MAEVHAQAAAGPHRLGGGHRLQEIDVLRGLAALTVVLSHYIPYWDRYIADLPVIVPGDAGNYAVRLFFAISGLVIFLTLDKCRTVLDFGVLRFSRLYPTYWMTLAISALVVGVIFGEELWMTGVVANFTMLQEFAGFGNFDNVYWSLTVELAFYLNVAWLFALGLHRSPLRCVAIWLLLSGAWALAYGELREPARDWLSIFTALDYAPYFAIGIVFYHAHGARWDVREGGLVALALVVEFVIAGGEGLAVAAGVVALMFAATHGYLAFLVGRVTLWLGAISYALYLIHRNVGYHMLSWFAEQGVGPVAAIVVTTAGALLAASLVTALLEKPVSGFIRRRYRAFKSARSLVPASP